MSEDVLSLSQFKADATRLLDQVRDEAKTLVLTQNERARAVVQDYEHYQGRERAMLMLKLMAQGERDVSRGDTVPQGEVFAERRQRLRAQRDDAVRGEDGCAQMAEREVRWTRTAERDLDAIVSYIAEDSIDHSLAVLDGRRDLRSVLLERLVRL